MRKQARGEVRRLLKVVGVLQNDIGKAMNLHYNDVSQTAFTEAQELLQRAFNLCLQTTGEYDPIEEKYNGD